MSYEASAHEVQMGILRHLLLNPDASFAQLQKRCDLTSDHFNFHIKKLIEVGYVIKNESQKYELTRSGKEYANRMDTDEKVIEKQPKLSVALVIENNEGKILIQQRLKQPYYGFWGLPTGKIRWGETTIDAATRELMEETGLKLDLRVSGVYHKMDFDKKTEDFLEDKYFMIIYGANPSDELISDVEGCHNEWLMPGEVQQKGEVFASIAEITKIAQKSGFDFIEEKHYYDSEKY